MKENDAYVLLGQVLIVLGLGLIFVSYLVLHAIPLTALGISSAIIGMVCLLLARTRVRIPPEASLLLLETGVENLAALIEEAGLRSKAFYLPSRIAGEPRALLPLHSSPPSEPLPPLARRLIVKYGPSPQEIGLLLATPGSKIMKLADIAPGASTGEIETALHAVIVGALDLASGVRVTREGSRISVELLNPSVRWERTALSEVLGSPVASIAASIVAEGVGKPVVVDREEDNLIYIEVLP